MYYLLKFKSDWADEFDVSGIRLFKSRNNLVDWQLNVQEGFKDGHTEWSFGSNESFEWESYEELERCISINCITEEDYDVLYAAFGGNSFGWIPEY